MLRFVAYTSDCFFNRFIDTYGTHIIVGVKMGGKDVIYAKQQHSSKLQPEELQKRLKEVADKRFVEATGVQNMASDRMHPSSKVEAKEQRLRFADSSSLGSYANKEVISFCTFSQILIWNLLLFSCITFIFAGHCLQVQKARWKR